MEHLSTATLVDIAAGDVVEVLVAQAPSSGAARPVGCCGFAGDSRVLAALRATGGARVLHLSPTDSVGVLAVADSPFARGRPPSSNGVTRTGSAAVMVKRCSCAWAVMVGFCSIIPRAALAYGASSRVVSACARRAR